MVPVKAIRNRKRASRNAYAARAQTAERCSGDCDGLCDYDKKSFEDKKSFVEKVFGVKRWKQVVEVQTNSPELGLRDLVAESTKIARHYTPISPSRPSSHTKAGAKFAPTH